jgi:hypothetical protein
MFLTLIKFWRATMLNLDVGVLNIESEEVESLLNVHPNAMTRLIADYSEHTGYALWIKNTVSGDINIATANSNTTEVRRVITTLLS